MSANNSCWQITYLNSVVMPDEPEEESDEDTEDDSNEGSE